MAPEQNVWLGKEHWSCGGYLRTGGHSLRFTDRHAAASSTRSYLDARAGLVKEIPLHREWSVPSCPEDLESICLKCLRKSRVIANASAGELARTWRAFLDGRDIQARPVGALVTAARWLSATQTADDCYSIAAASTVGLVVGSLEFAENGACASVKRPTKLSFQRI